MSLAEIIASIDREIAVLRKAHELLSKGAPAGAGQAAARRVQPAAKAGHAERPKKRRLSPEGRRRIAEAVRRRWEAQRKAAAASRKETASK